MNAPPEKKKKGGGVVALVVIISLCVLSVPCVGALSAIAIPAFIGYLNRAKTSEARSNLLNMYTGAAGYYESENWGGAGGLGGAVATSSCAVGNARTTNTPSNMKTVLGPLDPAFEAIGFALRDPIYYQYEIVGVGGCGHSEGEPIYSFRAYGDLDGDGVTSLFEISAAAGPDGTLLRSPGVFTQNELE